MLVGAGLVLFSRCPVFFCPPPQETSLDDFRSSLKDKWEVRVGLEEEEKEAAKAAKKREMESKKEVRIVHAYACV